MTLRPMLTAAVVTAVLAAAVTAEAQGQGNAYGRTKNARPAAPASGAAPAGPAPSTPAPSGSPVPAAGSSAAEFGVAGLGIRNFGSWLDDASILPAGRGFISVGMGVWRMPGYQEIDVPTLDTSVGIHRRVQVGGSVPYFHANEPGGPVARGFGTVYLNAKVQLRAPSSRGAGFSITPMLEVPGAAPLEGSRVSWALPLNVELQRTGWRTYASTGYFSRGAFFASAAVERSLTDRVWVSGTLSGSYSTREDALSTALGLSRSRLDVSGGAGVSLSPALAVFGSLGRTISRQDANSSTLALAGGIAINFEVR